MKITIENKSILDSTADLIVVNLFEGVKTPSGATGAVDKAFKNVISKFIIKQEKFSAKLGEIMVVTVPDNKTFKRIAVIGLGKSKEFNLEKVRTLGIKLYRKLKVLKNVKKIGTILHGAGIAGLDPELCAQMFSEGLLSASYEYNKYKTKPQEPKFSELVFCETDKKHFTAAKKGIKTAQILAEAQNSARDLINEPAMFVTPQKVAEIAKSIKGVKTTVYSKAQAKKMGMNAFLAVGEGSVNPPEFIHMKYTPAKGKPKRKIAFIGKGITFDSGGLDLKPAASMLTMKDDMSGAASILSLMKAVVELQPNLEIHGIIAACENMPSGSSYKPGDVLTAKNGKTIEVDNTDAEGRITLADALCYAEELKVDEIIDMATLTGACVVALGTFVSGVMGNNQKLIDKVIECAYQSGEKFWQLPMFEEYGKVLESDIADMKNTGSRYGGASSAGVFLNNFVKSTPWCHIDIAGTAYLDKAGTDGIKGPTGVGIKTLINYVRSYK